MAYVPRLKKRYQKEIVPALKERFGYDNVMEVPRLTKISINRGIGDADENKKALDDAIDELRRITGQHPSITRAKKSISNFGIRDGVPVGCRVTLRDARMYEFVDRLVTLALPRQRDFQGIPDRSFDGRGNYTLGIAEQIIFPEINVDNVSRIDGMDVTFVTTAETDEEAYALLKELGMPFVRRDEDGETEREKEAERQKAEREAALREAREEEEIFEKPDEPDEPDEEGAEGAEGEDDASAAAEARTEAAAE